MTTNNKIKMIALTLAIPSLFIASSAKAEAPESNECEAQAAACEKLRGDCEGSPELCFERELNCLADLGGECFELGDDELEDDDVLGGDDVLEDDGVLEDDDLLDNADELEKFESELK